MVTTVYKIDDLVVTPVLRYVVRDGQKILQQAFVDDRPSGYRTKKFIWKDVPIWDEKTAQDAPK